MLEGESNNLCGLRKTNLFTKNVTNLTMTTVCKMISYNAMYKYALYILISFSILVGITIWILC
jgi:hypothetical protein